jgi:hypothetical protein
VALGIVDTWRRLNFEQRVAAVASVLLIVSTFGPFSFVEGAIVLIGLSVLFLLRRRAEGREFHVPFGDGAVIAAAGFWSGLLIIIRLFDRPLGQGLLALVCAAVLVVAGLAERRKHLPDDLPGPAPDRHQRDAETVTQERVRPRRRRASSIDAKTAERRLFDPESGAIDRLRSVHDSPTEPLPPPEFKLPPRTPRRPNDDDDEEEDRD